MDCCEGLTECVGFNGTQRHSYLCLPACLQTSPPLTSNEAVPSPPPGDRSQQGWRSSGELVGSGWCQAEAPAQDWSLKQARAGGMRVRVLTYNLFWWNLFGRRDGNGGSAGRLIAKNGPFDILAFQECEDAPRVLRDANLAASHAVVTGDHATAIAYDRNTWELLASGDEDVAEDMPDQWYGRRGVAWVRLRHAASGKVVFAANHHGPLPINSGGVCGSLATAYNLLRVLGRRAAAGDLKLLLGDLNAEEGSATQRALEAHLHLAARHWVDAVFGSCRAEAGGSIGKGGSDHEAVAAAFNV